MLIAKIGKCAFRENRQVMRFTGGGCRVVRYYRYQVSEKYRDFSGIGIDPCIGV